MRRLWPVPYLAIALCNCLWGQNDVTQRIQRAYDLEQKGQFGQAVEILRPLTGSHQASDAEEGRIWISLGYAYQEESDFAEARRCYEQAAGIFRDRPSDKANYGTALDNLADWYREMGKLRAAHMAEMSALQQYREAGDHSGAASALMHLAVIELTRKREFETQQYLDAADEEARLARTQNDDLFAELYSTRGWLAEVEGNTSTAIYDYGQSLALRTCKSCMLAGWDYMLLGKAYANDGRLTEGLNNMRKGLVILSDTSGQHSRRYLAAEIAYAQVLDSSGEHAKSTTLKIAAKREMDALDRGRCASCREGLVANR